VRGLARLRTGSADVVIDHRLYEKVTGRRGDPRERAALASAQFAIARGARSRRGGRMALTRLGTLPLKVHYVISVILSLFVLAAVVLALVRW
jgi:hypothetical protein